MFHFLIYLTKYTEFENWNLEKNIINSLIFIFSPFILVYHFVEMSIDLIKYVDRTFFENIVSVFKAILRSFQVGSVIIKAIVLCDVSRR